MINLKLFNFNFWAKFLLIGLVIHFFLHTYITFFWNLEINIIWLWKEILIIGFFLYLFYLIFKNKEIKFWWKDKTIFILEMLFAILVIFTFVVNTFFIDNSLSEYIMAFRYDFLAYLIFFTIYRVSYFIKPSDYLLKYYGIIIKRIILFGVLWYIIIFLKPGFLKFAGYNKNIFEGEVGSAPPAAYYTQLNQGIVRNQFLFERPINYGFFLIAFFPLFYMLYLRKKAIKKTWFWWIVYGFNILTTFSRAAWGAFVFEILILTIIDYRKNMKYFMKYILFPILFIFSIFIYFAYDHIIGRQRSNTGHINEVIKGIDMFISAPIIGKGAGYVGPASFWEGGIEFNPENQFLQIAIEFGSIGFLMWFGIYLFFVFYGLYYLFKSNKKEKNNKYILYVLAFSIGLIGLSIQGMVLHSFVDRMIIYPFMFLFAIAIYLHRYKNI
ncbi:O-antigen ligase family protein [Candidatus Vampirococcus lugosii]|uniref:O-antigen ligase n=1 Tax=Candidatus Vampirococcus lugosii TaxID=2789015 RepID=A0ABS5QMX3_9BACT|nr:O-antigen ligase family protein [Candidatus Vampirococcus lugosii]MBS8122561.1 O-antigen ligase [Candidatus Vampirococcus lugosii]